MKIAAIVQARMGSSRLPGKVLEDVIGKPMLWHLINRLKRSKSLDEIIIATTFSEVDKPILGLAADMGVASFAGDEKDVLDRYYQAAVKSKVDVICRVTADCPLIDPHIVDKVINHFIKGKI